MKEFLGDKIPLPIPYSQLKTSIKNELNFVERWRNLTRSLCDLYTMTCGKVG